MERRTIAVALVMLVATVAVVPGGAGTVAAQDAGYDVTVSFPSNFTVGDDAETIAVTVDNTDGGDDVFSPIVEVPIPASASVPADATQTAYVELANGTTLSRTAEVDNSTYRDGDAFFVNGEEVPSGEVRTYHLNLTFDSTGEKSVEAEVRPLYNENVQVRDSTTGTANGFGTLNARVVDTNGADLASSDASVLVNGSVRDANISDAVVEGAYNVSATSDRSVALPSVTLSVPASVNRSVTFVARDSVAEPAVLARTTSASVPGGSVGNVTTDPTAVQPEVVEVSYLLTTNGGRAIVGLAHPIADYESVSVGTDRGTVSATETTDVLQMDVESSDDATVNATYTGYRLGDGDGDGTVNAADASAVAQAVASGSTPAGSADVNGDGEVTAVDAMYIAQYDAGNRDATYQLTAGEA